MATASATLRGVKSPDDSRAGAGGTGGSEVRGPLRVAGTTGSAAASGAVGSEGAPGPRSPSVGDDGTVRLWGLPRPDQTDPEDGNSAGAGTKRSAGAGSGSTAGLACGFGSVFATSTGAGAGFASSTGFGSITGCGVGFPAGFGAWRGGCAPRCAGRRSGDARRR